MPDTEPHTVLMEKILRESQVQNKALMAMNKSLIRDVSNKLTALDGRVALLEIQNKGKFDAGIYFRDKVLPQILTIITLAILALAFAPK